MERRIFHGNLTPTDISQALMAEFNHGNIHAQTLGQKDNLVVQIATRPSSRSGGQTAMSVHIQKVPDGILVELGQQDWFGIAASMGATALSAIRNPFNLIGRLDDLAQDIESLNLKDSVWAVIGGAVATAGASHQISERLRRITCEYCTTANPVGEASCLACGAPLGKAQPLTCRKCGFVILRNESICPNCGNKKLPA